MRKVLQTTSFLVVAAGVVGGIVGAAVVDAFTAQNTLAAISLIGTLGLLAVTKQYVDFTKQYVELTGQMVESTKPRVTATINQVSAGDGRSFAVVKVFALNRPITVDHIWFEWVDAPSQIGWTGLAFADLAPGVEVVPALGDAARRMLGTDAPALPHRIEDGGVEVWGYKVSCDQPAPPEDGDWFTGYRAIRAIVTLASGETVRTEATMVRPVYTGTSSEPPSD